MVRMGHSDIGLIEKGRLLPTADQIERIARALGVSAKAVLRPVEIAFEWPEEAVDEQAGE